MPDVNMNTKKQTGPLKQKDMHLKHFDAFLESKSQGFSQVLQVEDQRNQNPQTGRA